ncbi:MAG: class I SAM-dependent methyltransferase [Candidatus Magasanikbacteria bacterium]|nr:class I SAM-dependent methyltransferase [Candidatus Magasanikbacteria bacterium]
MLEEKIRAYYTRYYRDTCSLSDWQPRVEARLHEEDQERDRAAYIQKLSRHDFRGEKHCIIGAGTGGLAMVLAKEYGVDVYGVEPEPQASAIIQEKCRTAGIEASHFTGEYAEQMSWPDNTFDLVHCFTVLEHVGDVNRALDEMIRIIKPGGAISINTPNYAFPYDGHYKVFLPTFLPRAMCSWYLRLRGKNPAFLRTINFLTERSINRLLSEKSGIRWLRIYQPQVHDAGWKGLFSNYLKFRWGIYANQEMLIVKM